TPMFPCGPKPQLICFKKPPKSADTFNGDLPPALSDIDTRTTANQRFSFWPIPQIGVDTPGIRTYDNQIDSE
ncbi:MAG: hypothetical protein Q8N20_02695, partial [Eubacteriales bacterium]|nr:hypothetical protein [Eubacteriales bacterium]